MTHIQIYAFYLAGFAGQPAPTTGSPLLAVAAYAMGKHHATFPGGLRAMPAVPEMLKVFLPESDPPTAGAVGSTAEHDCGFGAGVKYATDWLRERGYGDEADRIAEQSRVPEAFAPTGPVIVDDDDDPT